MNTSTATFQPESHLADFLRQANTKKNANRHRLPDDPDERVQEVVRITTDMLKPMHLALDWIKDHSPDGFARAVSNKALHEVWSIAQQLGPEIVPPRTEDK